MDPHLLRTFVAVAGHGSFSEAARELGYTQSAVSQHIAALEKDLGAVLLQRRPVAPTGVGVRLLEHARPLLLRWDAARADMARLTTAPATRIVLGVAPLAMTAWLSSTLADLRGAQPGLDVTVHVLGRAALTRDVATATVDLGLVDGMAAPADPLHLPDAGILTATALAEQPLAVALPAQHPLADRAGLRLSDLADAQWIEAPDTAIPLAQLRTASGSDGYRTSLRYEGTDVRGLTALIAAGHGLALLPQRELDDLPGIHAVPLRTPRLVHRTEALHHQMPDGPTAQLASALVAAT
ncbi:LysR family transcriptional regulator [Streptomyces decoyicus]|uniref:LysR family transcriptional regulator n=1 Tax=Streptomyces decoyicus TaxID=249567 RepID=UPI0004AB9979|nr:LysR family transcriptional regulator [Streptomyces decoyicus]KOG41970.1 LysR family transcriptional regulator [Streptomyces decoyicus]QZY14116.1 LysR family transcriptional regulator [Streptomyces decoyicus]